MLSTDDKEFGGHSRIDHNTDFFTTPMEWNGRKNWLQVGCLSSEFHRVRSMSLTLGTLTGLRAGQDGACSRASSMILYDKTQRLWFTTTRAPRRGAQSLETAPMIDETVAETKC